MAEAVSIVGTVAGLLTLAGTVAKQLRIAYATFTEAQAVVQSIQDEVEAITTVVRDLKDCVSSPGALHNVPNLSALNGFVSETHRTLDAIREKLSKLQCADSGDRKWKRRRWMWEKSETNELLQSLQRHKISLTLALQTLSVYVDCLVLSRKRALKLSWAHHRLTCRTSLGDLHDLVSSHQTSLGFRVEDIRTAVLITQRSVSWILAQMNRTQGDNSRFHQQIQSQLDDALRPATVACSRGRGYDVDHEDIEPYRPATSSDSALSVKHISGSFGTLTLASASASHLLPDRFLKPGGMGFRLNYAPPRWMLNLVLSVSLAVGFSPRPYIEPSLQIHAVVPKLSSVSFVERNDLAGLKRLYSTGQGHPRDQEIGGMTALHVSKRQHGLEPLKPDYCN